MAKLTFDDEFNSFSMWNGTSGTWATGFWWSPDGYSVPGNATWWTNPNYGPTSAPDANPFQMQNGVLDIEAIKTPADVSPSAVNYQPYISGLLTTEPSFSQEYGYFEMRAEMPSGDGLMGAFWLLPEDGSRPPELDIVEVVSKNPTTVVNTIITNDGGPETVHNTWTTVADTTTAYHTYAVDWEADYITWYFDGVQTFKQATPSDAHQPMYMLLDTLVGNADGWAGAPDASTQFPSGMKVDYVRVYDSNPYTTGGAVQTYNTSSSSTTTTSSSSTTTTAPSPVTTGSGPDSLVLRISEDPYANGDGTSDANGDAIFTVSVDGKQIGGTFTALALHSSGTSQTFTFNGDWAPGTHTVAINFLNDAWDGTSTNDRNLYVDAVTYDGANTNQSAALYVGGVQNLTVTDTTATLTSPPTVSAVTASPGSGDLSVGASVTLTMTFSAAVFVAGGTPTLTLNDGGTATYASGSGSNALVFKYTVAAGQNTADLALAASNAISLNGATIRDSAGNNAVLTGANAYAPTGTLMIDTTAPTISGITTSPGTGQVTTGAVVALTVTFSEAVTVAGGTPTLALNDGGTATYVSGSGSSALVFNYTVAAGQSTADLALAASNAISLNGSTIRDGAGNNAVLTGANGYAPAGTLQINPVTSGVTTGSGSDTLVLSIAEDAWANGDGTSDAKGDAIFTVSVDGVQLAGTFTATASHAAGASQTFTFKGDWAAGSHTVGVNFLNDAWGGTSTTDRNLYVNAVTFDAVNTGQSAVMLTSGARNFSVTDSTSIPPSVIGSGSDRLVLKMSEDAYLGNAQFTVSVDGKQLGGTLTATALHSTGSNQSFVFAGDFGSGQHTVSVNFVNDAWAGTAATDRNLYVNDIIYNGTDTGLNAVLYSNGPKTFAVSGGTTPSVSETGDHGSLQKNLSQTGTYTVGGDTFVLSSGNAVSVTLGAGTSSIAFIGATAKLTGGSGQATVKADTGTNTFTAGSGSLDVTGGGGQDTYVFHATSGLLTVEDFSAAKGDKLVLDKSLQSSFHQGTDGQGGTLITFGAGSNHAVDIHGIAAVSSSSITWA
jgi:beta-glucanase (GH16 family)